MSKNKNIFDGKEVGYYLCRVEGRRFNPWMVIMWDGEFILQYISFPPELCGWFGISDNIIIKEIKFIEGINYET